ncbi:MAG: AAA family ATPase, partial [Candidatus Tectomicrobia bacterium]|nr:AAA family ATPase [Candidatus Tectomicrobia bacterium]
AMEASVLERAVFVPIPPSKAKDDDGYDDRLERMLRAVRPQRPRDGRALIAQTRSVEPTHLRSARLRASDIEELYRIDEEVAAPSGGLVVVVDDLLTSGAHFRAAQRTLSRRFPDIDVVGLFLARRVAEPGERRAAETTGPGRKTVETGDGATSREAARRATPERRGAGLKIVSIINYKGGVGKTTLTANLAAELARRGKRILALDMDAQCSLTFSFVTPDYWESELGGQDGGRKDRTIKRWFDGIVEDEGDIIALDRLVLRDLKVGGRLGDSGGCLHLIPSHLGLINIDLDLAYRLSGVPPNRLHQRRSRVFGQLRRHLNAYASEAGYDYVLIDCPPNFNIVTKNAIVASDQIVIPAKPDYLSTLGIDYLLRSLGALIEEFNEGTGSEAIDPDILGVIFTMIQIWDGRPIGVQRQYMRPEAIAVPIFESTVRENKTMFGDAPEDGVPVVLKTHIGQPYRGIVGEVRSLTDEFLKLSGGGDG